MTDKLVTFTLTSFPTVKSRVAKPMSSFTVLHKYSVLLFYCSAQTNVFFYCSAQIFCSTVLHKPMSSFTVLHKYSFIFENS